MINNEFSELWVSCSHKLYHVSMKPVDFTSSECPPDRSTCENYLQSESQHGRLNFLISVQL